MNTENYCENHRIIDCKKLNIVFANNYIYLRGGSERVVFDEMSALKSLGHSVNLFGRSSNKECDLPHGELFPPVIDLSGVRGFGKLKAAKAIIYNKNTGERFAEFYERTKPEIVHAHNIYAGLTTSIVDICRQKKVPCLITLHDYKLACPVYTMLRNGRPCQRCNGSKFFHCILGRCHKNSYSASLVSTIEAYYNTLLGKYVQADYLITPSHFLLDKMLESGIPQEKLICIPNGVKPDDFTPLYGDEGYFLYFGRLSSEKGLNTLLTSMKGIDFQLKIVGDGPERPSLETYCQNNDLKNITFEGYQSGARLRKLIQKSAFVVVPSEWYENASMVVLESMAYGKPIIASRIGGIPEQVADGETGLLCEPGNPDDFRKAIVDLATDSQKRKKMGKAGRQRLEQHFSIDHHLFRLLEIYKKAIRGE